jgi:hypothetical protein
MSDSEAGTRTERRLREETAWLTTVRSDGQGSPRPYRYCGTARRSLHDPKNAHARGLRSRTLLEEKEAHEVELALV